MRWKTVCALMPRIPVAVLWLATAVPVAAQDPFEIHIYEYEPMAAANTASKHT